MIFNLQKDHCVCSSAVMKRLHDLIALYNELHIIAAKIYNSAFK